jgi:catechol 2,3-dioxygenase-like lactoylglutathione lyase family enzyme
MSLAHLTLPTREVEKTAAFLERTLGYVRDAVPDNVPEATVWLNIGRGQQIHVFRVDGFEVSPFEHEFGRHVAVYYPRREFRALKQRLLQHGADLIEPLRPTPFERFFFREPTNGYLFEVIDQNRDTWRSADPLSPQDPGASHLDQ